MVEALVLDVAKAERLVDLTLKPELISRSRERSSMSHTKKKVEHFLLPQPPPPPFFLILMYIIFSHMAKKSEKNDSNYMLWSHLFELLL